MMTPRFERGPSSRGVKRVPPSRVEASGCAPLVEGRCRTHVRRGEPDSFVRGAWGGAVLGVAVLDGAPNKTTLPQRCCFTHACPTGRKAVWFWVSIVIGRSTGFMSAPNVSSQHRVGI